MRNTDYGIKGDNKLCSVILTDNQREFLGFVKKSNVYRIEGKKTICNIVSKETHQIKGYINASVKASRAIVGYLFAGHKKISDQESVRRFFAGLSARKGVEWDWYQRLQGDRIEYYVVIKSMALAKRLFDLE